METTSGDLAGFDVDLGRRLADSLGVRAAFVLDSLGGLVPGLQAGRYDVAMTGLNVTPERLALVDFTRTHSRVQVALLPRRDRPDLTSFAAVDRPGVSIGVLAGSSAEPLLQAIVRRATIQRYGGELALFLAFRDAEVDAAVVYGDQIDLARRAFPDLVGEAEIPVTLARGGHRAAERRSRLARQAEPPAPVPRPERVARRAPGLLVRRRGVRGRGTWSAER